jgi:hypothetical protein
MGSVHYCEWRLSAADGMSLKNGYMGKVVAYGPTRSPDGSARMCMRTFTETSSYHHIILDELGLCSDVYKLC